MKILKDNTLVDFDGNLFEKNGKISFVDGNKVYVDDNVKYIVPGFIDIHIHGVKGSDAMDNSMDALLVMKEALVYEGTTSFLPTTLTYDLDVLKSVLNLINDAKDISGGANVLGAHVEGPFIDVKYKGAQNEKYIVSPSIDTLKYIDQHDVTKVITFAAEHDKDFEFTKYLKEKGIVASLGHSGASCHVANEAIKNGVNSFTHFHNGSSGHHHRTPGVVTSGLMNKDVNVEMIVDGIHLHPDTVNMVYKIKDSKNITLITDSMRAKQMPDGTYDLGGQEVVKKGDSARLSDGVLAGSILQMNNAVKNILSFTGCTPAEAFQMASYNQAKLLKVENKGLLTENYDFDVTMLDEEFNVVATYVNGKKETK